MVVAQIQKVTCTLLNCFLAKIKFGLRNPNYLIIDWTSVSSFKQNLFIIGGEIRGNNYVKYLRSCLVYDIKCDNWSLIADMKEERSGAACAVHEGKIVVSGG